MFWKINTHKHYVEEQCFHLLKVIADPLLNMELLADLRF